MGRLNRPEPIGVLSVQVSGDIRRRRQLVKLHRLGERATIEFLSEMTAREIIKALGGRWHGGYGTACCPAHDDREPSLSVSDGRDGKLLVHCHAGCEGRDVLLVLKERGLLGERISRHRENSTRQTQKTVDDASERADAENRTKLAFAIWQASLPAQGTAVETYLRSRGITFPIPPSIRYHPALKHGFTGLFFEAMVAGVQAPNRTITAVHRTFLLPGGRGKANVKKPKLALGPCAGGAVRLAAAGPELVLAEGIETALSVLQATNKPMWATVGTSGLKTVALPQEVETVIIAADSDEPGIAAAEEAAKRFWREGRTVKIARPPPGFDFNDLLMLPKNVTPFQPKDVANG